MMTIRVYTTDRLAPMINRWQANGWTLTQIEIVTGGFLFWSYIRYFNVSFERTPPDNGLTLEIEFGPVSDQALTSQ